jgi:hypothetical protein
MFDFWLDNDSLIVPYRSYYSFDRVPAFWEFLENESHNGIIVSSSVVLQEIENGCRDDEPDQLLIWARKQEGVLFLVPDAQVQQMNRQIADKVRNNPRFPLWHVQNFLKGADTWLIAHAKVLGGKIVTFETSAPLSQKPKIPDIADDFGVTCVDLFDMLDELGAKF